MRDPTMDFASRVAHFDIQESDKSDDDDDVSKPKAKSADDIEKEYLIGGGRNTYSVEDEETVAPEGGCCARSCGGNDKAARVEGRNILLSVTILSMAVAGLLLYSSWQQLSSPNRRVLCIIGFVLGCTAELCAIIGLIGLARFSDTEKIPFKLGYWLNLVQLWAYAGYIGFLLFLWDGNYASGTLALSSAKSAAPASGAASTPALIELGVAALAPTTGSGSTAAANWFKFLSTQLWFISITAILILLSLLYVYGSLRLRCKKMGKWGTAMTAFFLSVLAMATIAFGALTIKYHPSIISVTGLTPVAGQMAVGALILATAIYELYVSTQVQKLKLAAKNSFNTLLIMTFVSVLLVSVCYYTYYQAIRSTPRIDLLHLTALAGVASQVLLFGFGVQLMAWRYALPDEYPAQPAMEKFGNVEEETDAFLPPTDY